MVFGDLGKSQKRTVNKNLPIVYKKVLTILIELKCEIFTFRILGESDSAQNKKAKPLHDASQQCRNKVVKLFHLQQIY